MSECWKDRHARLYEDFGKLCKEREDSWKAEQEFRRAVTGVRDEMRNMFKPPTPWVECEQYYEPKLTAALSAAPGQDAPCPECGNAPCTCPVHPGCDDCEGADCEECPPPAAPTGATDEPPDSDLGVTHECPKCGAEIDVPAILLEHIGKLDIAKRDLGLAPPPAPQGAPIRHGVSCYRCEDQPDSFSIWVHGIYYGIHDTYAEAAERFEKLTSPVSGIDPEDVRKALPSLDNMAPEIIDWKNVAKNFMYRINELIAGAGAREPVVPKEWLDNSQRKVERQRENIKELTKKYKAAKGTIKALNHQMLVFTERLKMQTQEPSVPNYPSNQGEGCAICGVPGRIGRAIYLCERCADKPMVPASVIDEALGVMRIWKEADFNDPIKNRINRNTVGDCITHLMYKVAPYRRTPSPKAHAPEPGYHTLDEHGDPITLTMTADKPVCKRCNDEKLINRICTDDRIKSPHNEGEIPCPDCAAPPANITPDDLFPPIRRHLVEGNLAKIRALTQAAKAAAPVCETCGDTRTVPCDDCDANGYYSDSSTCPYPSAWYPGYTCRSECDEGKIPCPDCDAPEQIQEPETGGDAGAVPCPDASGTVGGKTHRAPGRPAPEPNCKYCRDTKRQAWLSDPVENAKPCPHCALVPEPVTKADAQKRIRNRFEKARARRGAQIELEVERANDAPEPVTTEQRAAWLNRHCVYAAKHNTVTTWEYVEAIRAGKFDWQIRAHLAAREQGAKEDE